MAKVFLSITSYNSVTYSKEKVKFLNYHSVPFEINDNKIYLISKSEVSVRSREYDEVYSKFCMQIADSSDAPISLGEGALEEDKLPVLINVFGNHLEFYIDLMCNDESASGQLYLVKNEDTGEINWESHVEEPEGEDAICENCGYENYMCDCEKDEEDDEDDEDETIELKEELEETPVSLKHLTSFAVLFDSFFGYNKAKSMDELHQLIKHNVYDGSWDLLKENWSESCGLYDQLLDGTKTYEEAFDKMVVILKGSNLDENQTTAFLDLTLKMYLDTYKSEGVLDNELNEDNSFNTNHPNYVKFNVFSYLEKSFENQVVVKFLNSKRPLQELQLSDDMYQTIFLKENFHKVFSDNFLKKTTIENKFIHIDIEGSSLNISYNLDENYIDDSIFNDNEIPFNEIISELEEKLPLLKDFLTEDFEIIYFTYDSEYTSTIWQFDNNTLSTNSGWIGDFCEACESIQDEDERDDAQSEFVNENSAELKEGCPSDELLKAMREGLYKI